MNVLAKKIRQFFSIPIQMGTILFWLLSFIPIFLYLFLVIRYSINIPFNDEWGVVSLYKSLRDGTLSLLTLWQPHNEHRSLLFYLIYLGLAQLSGFNALVPLYFGTLFKIITLLMVYDLLRITLKDHSGIVVPLTLFSSVFIFSAQEGEIIIWGFASLLFNLGALFTILLFWGLTRYPRTWKGMFIAAAASLGGSLISANGVFLWGFGLFGLLIIGFTDDKKIINRKILFWLLAMTFFLFIYFKGYHAVDTNSSLIWVLHNKRMSLLYFLSYMASLTVYYNEPQANLPIIFGCVGLVLFGLNIMFLLIKKNKSLTEIKNLYPWLLLPLYVLGVAGVTTIGRAQFGVWQAGSSRYVAMSYPFWLSLFVLTSVLVDDVIVRRFSNSKLAITIAHWGVTPLIIILPIYIAYIGAFNNLLPFWYDRIATGLSFLYSYESGPSQGLTYIYNGNPAEIIPDIKYLDENNLGPFANGYRPANDFMAQSLPVPTNNDYLLSIEDEKAWHYKDIQPIKGEVNQWNIIGPGPKIEFDVPIVLCLDDYSHIYFQAAIPTSFTARWAQIIFQVDNQLGYDFNHRIPIPYLVDNNLHSYSFDLSLLKYSRGTKINGFYIKPISDGTLTDIHETGNIMLRDVRLIHIDQSSSACSNP